MSTLISHAKEQRLIDLASELSAKFALTAAEIDRNAELPKDNLRELFERGLDTAVLPEEKGGAGISYRTFGRIVFEIARGCPSTACVWLMNTAAAESLITLSSPERSEHYLREWKQGKRFANALSEPSSGNLFLNPVQEATPLGDGDWSLDGAKRFVSGAELADYFLINASIDGQPAFFGVERDDTVDIHDIWDALGMRGTRSQLIGFRGTRLQAANRFVEAASPRQNLIALGLPWLSLGIAQAAYDALIAQAKGKKLADGKPLSLVQWIQYETADVHVRLKAAKLLAERLLELADEGSRETIIVSMEAKILANQIAKDAADLGLRVGGGLAFTRALSFERHLRDAQAGGLMAYSSELCRLYVAKYELGVQEQG
ncbi:acyl-CoA dehydrogenase family protein [Cohnella phaseoli]|uniref:Alkylation response protein AidB-like acyl-CoA dehydrogenase n=1 Tax=Cohnella phaseoli TaxID=456490 RepID=A0A3D9IXV6_9BACL|nr:acyl-CoA dehydrogenase family protein [Cohnella phaseoli]RED66474.1 alkylation response protein AidB-like acyl-CoA dehydrogenase [Cohnella phaseoli]